MRTLIDTVHRQLHLNESRNMLHADGAALLDMDATFIDALEELATFSTSDQPPVVLDSLADETTSLLMEAIFARNPYIQIDEAARKRLKTIYLDSWRQIVETKDVTSTLREYHYPRIRGFIESLYPDSLKDALREAPMVGRVPWSEYSAEIQRWLFRLDNGVIREPLLDIGCGGQAHLVRFLRLSGYEAYGIDRMIDARGSFLERMDWFAYTFRPASWGTIISNLAFSSNFRYTLTYDPEGVRRYRETYTSILASLMPGGSFLYTPDLPEVENGIDGKLYSIETWPVSAEHRVTRVTRIELR